MTKNCCWVNYKLVIIQNHIVVYFIALKAKVSKLHINELVNVLTSSNNLKTKMDDLDVVK